MAQLKVDAGNSNAARALLTEVLSASEQGNLKEERKGIRRKLDTIEG